MEASDTGATVALADGTRLNTKAGRRR